MSAFSAAICAGLILLLIVASRSVSEFFKGLSNKPPDRGLTPEEENCEHTWIIYRNHQKFCNGCGVLFTHYIRDIREKVRKA